MTAPTPDLSAARSFLARLDPEAESFTLQTFDDTPEKRPQVARVRHIAVAGGALDRLARLNRDRVGVFVTVNRTNGQGRKTHNIIEVRALFVDLDGPPLEPVLSASLEPHIVVESSPQRYHAYWLCDNCPLDKFGDAQKSTRSPLRRR